MTREEELIKRHMADLAEAVYTRSRYMFTDFLGLMEYDVFLSVARDFSYVPYAVWGGAEGCERVMVRFGDADTVGYAEEPFPIACLHVTPASPKFAEPLSHRDCLGALMNLGIKRECLGDILVRDGSIYLFCLEKMADYIAEHLTKIRNTTVSAARGEAPGAVTDKREEVLLHIASPRADAVVAHAYNLSRTDAAELFTGRRVFLDGRLCERVSAEIKAGCQVTVRGYGRFVYNGEVGTSRKGKLLVRIEKFV